MSAFTDALLAFIAAERNYDRVQHDDSAARFDVDEMAEQIAQAGDVLEREMRQMMRQEVRNSGAAVDEDWLRGYRLEMGFGDT